MPARCKKREKSAQKAQKSSGHPWRWKKDVFCSPHATHSCGAKPGCITLAPQVLHFGLRVCLRWRTVIYLGRSLPPIVWCLPRFDRGLVCVQLNGTATPCINESFWQRQRQDKQHGRKGQKQEKGDEDWLKELWPEFAVFSGENGKFDQKAKKIRIPTGTLFWAIFFG